MDPVPATRGGANGLWRAALHQSEVAPRPGPEESWSLDGRTLDRRNAPPPIPQPSKREREGRELSNWVSETGSRLTDG